MRLIDMSIEDAKLALRSLESYELIGAEELEDSESYGYLLRHKKSGARVNLIANEDKNKVFCIGFRTVPTDDTGVPHILEHSVLCGSKKYPTKDPFVELVKTSLNTFLNAMTYPDKTLYPIASCNDKDYHNLMSVYLDAVFYPNIYRNKEIFMQEGWHYELDDVNSELKISGVVYNEMKGAFSSPDDMLYRTIQKSLFPDNTYGVVSGGTPEAIPTLSYDQFLSLHREYYHPSNSYIYLYGNVDMIEKLEYIDREYLSNYEYTHINADVAIQPAFDKMARINAFYSITEDEPIVDNSYLAYNIAFQDKMEAREMVALSMIDYALFTAPGAPIKQALLDANIGKSIDCSLIDSLRQPIYSISAMYTNECSTDEFVKIIEDELLRSLHYGINKRSLLAGLNSYEFKYREADYGNYSAGLIYALNSFNSWLYDDNDPYCYLNFGDVFDELRDHIDTDYYEKLLEKYFINNNHKSIVTMVPKIGLVDEKNEATKAELAKYKNSLSEEELIKIVEETRSLIEYQDREDTKEDKDKLPRLTLDDVDREVEDIVLEVEDVDRMTSIFHDIPTKGIAYIRYIFSINNIPNQLLQYASILKDVLGLIDTKTYGYKELANEILIRTGGFKTKLNMYKNINDKEETKYTFEVSSKVLSTNIEEACELIFDILINSIIEDDKRLYEIISDIKANMQGALQYSSHIVAVTRASSYHSKEALFGEMTTGIEMYRFIEELVNNYEERCEELKTELRRVMQYIIVSDNMIIDCTGDRECYNVFKDEALKLRDSLPINSNNNYPLELKTAIRNEGFKSSSMVQYVCRAGNYKKTGLDYTGSLRILRVIMNYQYLWENIRVKGGAYGCMSAFGRDGNAYFVSYRDPNLRNTIDIYEGAADYLANMDVDKSTIEGYILGALSELERPLTPLAKGLRGLDSYMTGIDKQDLIKEKEELLSTDINILRGLSEYIRAFMEYECLCVVGNSELITSERELFMNIESLIKG